MKKGKLKADVKAIIELAKKRGIESSFFFETTLERYQTQLGIMEDLKKQIDELGPTVSKEYVKGRTNVYTNPAISEYNKTATAANGTVTTLLKIVSTLEPVKEESESKLNAFLKE